MTRTLPPVGPSVGPPSSPALGASSPSWRVPGLGPALRVGLSGACGPRPTLPAEGGVGRAPSAGRWVRVGPTVHRFAVSRPVGTPAVDCL